MAIEKVSSIVRELRGDIVSGRNPPGVLLPTRQMLLQRFKVGSATLQRAIDVLAKEGLVRGDGRCGTLVTPHPPHLCHYGLLMPNQRADGQVWLRSWEAMEAAAREMLTTPPQTLSLLYKSDLHDSLDRYKLFMEDLAAHRLAGVIVSSMPVAHLSDWPSTGPNALPVVVYGSSAPEGCAFSCNRAGLSMRRAFEYLLPLGRRRVGLMAQPAFFSADWFEPALADCVAEFGMRCEPRWRQVVMPNTSRATGHLAELMMADPDGPDALLVMDDNSVEEVIAGVRTAGKRIPEDVVLVVAGNFPWPEKYSAPIKRFGVSMKQFIAEAARHIDARRCGAVTSSRILLDVFDETEFQRQIGT